MFKKINLKSFISGLIIGLSLVSVPVLAEEAYRIYKNTYPIELDGVPQNIEALNINDYTFIKLASVGKLTNTNVKFNENTSKIEITKNASMSKISFMGISAIDYNNDIWVSATDVMKNKDSVLQLIETYMPNKSTPTPTPSTSTVTPTPVVTKSTSTKTTITNTNNKIKTYQKDGITIILYNNIEYIESQTIINKHKNINFIESIDSNPSANNGKFDVILGKEIYKLNIPFITNGEITGGIKYSDYEKYILPLLK